jgi:peroxiredoxin
MAFDLKIGDMVGAGAVYKINAAGIHQAFPTKDLLMDKRVIIFAGPAPFSRLDTEQAIAYAQLSKDLLKYVDNVYGLYCQDAFVMNQFDKHVKETVPDSTVEFYGDGDAFFIRAHKLEHDFTHQGLSLRSVRYAIVVKNEVIEFTAADDYTVIENTAAEKVLEWLKSQ